jgi:predicted nuclease of predicted toxin-antitoxin system
MRLVIDMNLSPQWIGYLRESGHEAVHWSSIGRPDAKDTEIASHIVLTSDLDFASILALSRLSKPSVVQLRTAATLPDRLGSLVAEALAQSEADLDTGALLTIEEGGAWIRDLPFDPEH